MQPSARSETPETNKVPGASSAYSNGGGRKVIVVEGWPGLAPSRLCDFRFLASPTARFLMPRFAISKMGR
jgi:hypothetical protein